MPWSTAISAAAGKFGAVLGSEIGDLWADIWDLSDDGRRNSRIFFGAVTGTAAGAVVGYAMFDPYGAHAGGAVGVGSVDFDVASPGTHHSLQFGSLQDQYLPDGRVVNIDDHGSGTIAPGQTGAGDEVGPNDTVRQKPGTT
ncbi:hypothetical protein ACF07W_28520 [Streptomyces sp. NPDC015140]|uniref:hypothetical protein n=1 Tax=Streptomyces sp. NPDC015140 TaxID=3364943 RepID=UPI0036FC6380